MSVTFNFSAPTGARNPGAISDVKSSSSAVAETAINQSQLGQGFDLFEIKAIDLTQFRKSKLPFSSYFLLLIPVIGWIAFGCLKCNYVMKHRAAEQVMKNGNFDAKIDLDEKIQVVSDAIKVSGPHAWQYRLELARLHLLKGESKQAANDLIAARNQRGAPEQTGRYNVRHTGLISFQVDNTANWLDCAYVMKINYNDGIEALLNAAVLAAKEQYEDAYDAYNEVIYYNKWLSVSRIHQCDLVAKMRQQHSLLSMRGRSIVNAENA